MRSSRSFIVASQLALLTLALVSCGGQKAPEASVAQDIPVAVAPQPVPTAAAGQIVKVTVRPGTTQADLLSRYPGATVLGLHADEGYAQLLATEAILSAPVVGALNMRAQDVVVAAIEPNITLDAAADEVENLGNGAWAGGNGAWAGGNGAWAGGNSGSGSVNALADNAPDWTAIDLGTGQKQNILLGQGIKVAVLDTGIDINHPAFVGRLDVGSGWDYVGNDGTPQEENWALTGFSKAFGHGTAVAGVILQVAPNATIVPYRVLSPNGRGDLSNIILALNNAVNRGFKVVNMSLGTTTPTAALNDAINSALAKGVMVVASSGNSGDTNITYPARYSANLPAVHLGGLLSVGSVSRTGKKSSFSTYGASIDVLAPGEGVATTFPGGLRTNATGTSFAAPMVSGQVALAMAAGRLDTFALSKSIKATATASADTAYLNQVGNGTINVGKLMVTK
jgi:thermitase